MKENTKSGWKKFGYLCLSCVPTIAYMAVMVGVSVVLAVFLAVKGMADGSDDMFSYMMDGIADYSMMAGTVYAVIGIIGLGLWYYFGCKRKSLKPPKGVLHPANLLILAVFGFCMQYVCTYLMALIGMLLPDALEKYEILMETAGVGEITVTGILYGVILGPIAEELTFRGLTLHYLNKFTKRFWLANILQALAFGIFHMNLIQGVYAFVLGLALGWIRMRFDSMYASIWLHIFFNFLAFGPMELFNRLLPESELFQIIWMFLMFVFAAVLLLLVKKRSEEDDVCVE